MNKTELVNKVKEATSLSQAQSAAAVTAVIDSIMGAIANKESVNIVGFGTFKSEMKPEREVRNPATGAKITVPAHMAPKFAFSESVKSKFKNGQQSEYIK